VEIMVNDFLKVALPAQSFDVVTMWHVLEHLPSPIPALEQATDLLERGGMLLIATPNPASIEASLFGRRWYHLDAPRHLVLIPPSSLIAALEELGMRVLHINFSIPAHNWTGIFSSIVSPQHIRPGMILPRRGDNPFRNALRHIAKSPFELLAQVEASLHRGGTYEICAVRTT
jgi:SAM-dependent methyltransferase